MSEHGGIPHLFDHTSIFPPQERVVALAKAVVMRVDPRAIDALRTIGDGCVKTARYLQAASASVCLVHSRAES